MIETETPNISVIVPIYNSELLLRRCIDSILSQTFTDFEVLLINDGSTDQSGSICNEYAKVDSRIRVFHKDNGGVSSARNLGLERVSGDWVLFVDSDDYIDSALLSKCVAKISDKNTEIDGIHFGYYSHGPNITLKKTPSSSILTNNQLLIGEFIPTLWLFLYKRKLLSDNNITFINSLKYCEDLNFLFKYLLTVKKIESISDSLYNYVNHDNSAMSQPISYSSIMNHIEACEDLMLYFNANSMNSYLFSSYFSYLLQGFLNRLVQSSLGLKQTVKLIHALMGFIVEFRKQTLYNTRLKLIVFSGIYPYVLLKKISNAIQK